MATSDSLDILAPKVLILPILNYPSTTSDNSKGTILISGANLVFYDGSAWRVVTSA